MTSAIRFGLLLSIAIILLLWDASNSVALAQGKGVIAREVAEYIIKKFSRDVAEETAETLTKKIESVAIRYGDEGVEAIQKVGPRAIGLIDEAGEAGAVAAKTLAKYGDEGAWLVGKSARMNLIVKHGDEAAEALMKHGEIAEPLIDSLGAPAARAISTISGQNARRLVMLSQEGAIAKMGSKSVELVEVISKYGDRAMEFIWKNKAALAVGTTLVAFLADPEPFLNGTRDLAQIAAETTVQPIAQEIGRRTNWTIVFVTIITLGAFAWLLRRRRIVAPKH